MAAGQVCCIFLQFKDFTVFCHLISNDGLAWIFFNLAGITVDKPDGQSNQENQLDNPPNDTICNTHTGCIRCHTCGKGVDGRGQTADLGTDQNDSNRYDRIKANRYHDGNQKRIEGHGFFPHTIGGTTQGKERQQHPNQGLFTTLVLANNRSNPSVQSTCMVDDPQEGPNHQDEEGNFDSTAGPICSQHPPHRSHENIINPLWIGRDNFIGT